MIPHTLTLDKPRTLRFDWRALCRLETEQGINPFNPAVLQEISPTKLRALVWAGLLHEVPGLKIEDVDAMLTGVRIPDLLGTLIGAYSEAIGLDAEEVDEDEEASPQNPED